MLKYLVNQNFQFIALFIISLSLKVLINKYIDESKLYKLKYYKNG